MGGLMFPPDRRRSARRLCESGTNWPIDRRKSDAQSRHLFETEAHSMSGRSFSRDRLKDRVAYITGGASGQGAAHTAHLAREGATVYFGDINRDAGAALQRRFVGEG